MKHTDYPRLLAGVFGGVGSLILIYVGETTAAVAILASMMAFFVGEQNGKRRSASQA